MNLKQLINASGGPARCASIWGISRQSVSGIFKRNSISKGLVEELIEYHKEQIKQIDSILCGDKDIDFTISIRRTNRQKCIDKKVGG